MCGITGFWYLNKPAPSDSLDKIAKAMAGKMEARGPDFSGTWSDQSCSIAFGHRRLSIIDLSPAGHQPMVSASGKSVICYNGELYNTHELRETLRAKGATFRGNSDTEVLLEACEILGVEAALQKVNGMFAFAFYNIADQQLFLARDRLGIKPLYWGAHKGVLFFASQMKCFQAHPDWSPEMNHEILPVYFQLNYIPAPHTIFKGIQKLRPGHFVVINKTAQMTEQCYWDFSTVAAEGMDNPSTLGEGELVQVTEALLADAVKRQMVADVPLGVFLSGGIDSSLVTALMQAQSEAAVKTFTIGFHEDEFNEAKYAKKIAKHLGTDHTEHYFHAQESLDLIEKMPDWYDEPFADSSQLPTYLVSAAAREKVTVCLSGDGGDELFAGYSRYFYGARMINMLNYMPHFLKAIDGAILSLFPASFWQRVERLTRHTRNLDFKMHKLAEILKTKSPVQQYRILTNLWPEAQKPATAGVKPFADQEFSGKNIRQTMQFVDTNTYLPDDILTKVDRASMATSLEVRVPFLDHRVVELAWKIPPKTMAKGGVGKYLLRQILKKHVPDSLFERPKRGFAVPVGEWLRGPLQDWGQDLLASIDQDDVLGRGIIAERWQQHQAGTHNWQHSLWGVLMFQAWRHHWKI